MNTKQKLAALRRTMTKYGVAAYFIPSTDAHQSEYVPTCWKRREWISGFTGSAGDVVVTTRDAALWTDGRYFIQAENQLKGSSIRLMKLGQPATPTIAAWLGSRITRGGKVGVDPRVFSIFQFHRFAVELLEAGLSLVSIEANLVDELWVDRPAMPEGPIVVHPVKFAGESFLSKLNRVRKSMKTAGAKAHIVASLDSIAWLFNIRGDDVDHMPVVIGYGIVTEKDATLFVNLRKVTPELRRAFGKSVKIRSYADFRTAVMRLTKGGGRVWVDPSSTNQWVENLLGRSVDVFRKDSAVPLMRAAKNAVEVRGARRAHVRDGVAMVRFLHAFESALGRVKITEVSLDNKLERIRAQSKLFRGTSFETIVGYAAHGAIIHYSATPETDVPIRKRSLMILDSGGQYLDGTTDITRTLCLGKPTHEQKDQFTRVLKGHIQLAMVSFPRGTSGKQLDTLARKALWDAGLNYDHGTGHGVGSYLGVHEGPQSISPTRDTGAPLLPGMICSNEPGYYVTGQYGIRTENLVCVVPDKTRTTKERTFYAFETLTLCPIELKLVEKKLMTNEETAWLNAYHARVRKTLSHYLNPREVAWLRQATRAI